MAIRHPKATVERLAAPLLSPNVVGVHITFDSDSLAETQSCLTVVERTLALAGRRPVSVNYIANMPHYGAYLGLVMVHARKSEASELQRLALDTLAALPMRLGRASL